MEITASWADAIGNIIIKNRYTLLHVASQEENHDRNDKMFIEQNETLGF
jgi:hypothetical protein